MIKKFSIFFLCILLHQGFSQTAPNYVPTEIGNVWVTNFYLLDSTGNPIGDPQIFTDSSVAYKSFLGRQTLFIVRKPLGVEIGDTSWISTSNQSIFIHIGNLIVDTLISLQLPDWFEYYRFGTSLGSFYTIHRIDTTLNIPNLGQIPLRLLLRGARLGNDTVSVPAGFFNATKFLIELKAQYLVALPPPLPPLAIDILTIPINDWLVQGKYIVKSVQEPVFIDTLNLTIPGSLRELVEFRTSTLVENEIHSPENFVLHQNYPNPFNGSTIISFNLPQRQFINLSVYNALGEKIIDLIGKELNPGFYSLEFNGEKFNLTSGVYYYTIRTNGIQKSRRMVYLK